MAKKQVVFIMTDTQRTDMISCYQDKGLKTPHIDSLAENGIKCTKAYTTQPVCGPARGALFTGMYPHSNGAVSNDMAPYPYCTTIGKRLSDHGIVCGYMGKWHLDGTDYYGNGICPEGFEDKYWYDMRRYLDELSEEERINSRRQDYAREKDLDPSFLYGHRVSNKAMEFLDEYKDRDFFLTVSYDEPHHPYLTPPPFNHMYDDFVFPNSPNVADTLADKPEHHRLWAGDNLKRDPATLVQKYPEYFACNAYVDHEIGRVVDKIRAVAPDALIIYTTDHGDMLESHCLTGKGPVAYEEVSHIPFIISGAGLQGAKTYDMPVSHIDLCPTVMDYFGLPQSLAFEGKSMLPVLKDTSVRINDYVFVEFTRFELDHDMYGGIQPYRAIVGDRYKLVVNLLTTDEFYDLETDPYEMTNLINDPATAEIRDQMHRRLIDWMNDTRDLYRGYYWERRPWRADGAERANWTFTGFTRQRMNLEYEAIQCSYETSLPITPETAVRRKSMWFGRWRDTEFAHLYNGNKKD